MVHLKNKATVKPSFTPHETETAMKYQLDYKKALVRQNKVFNQNGKNILSFSQSFFVNDWGLIGYF